MCVHVRVGDFTSYKFVVKSVFSTFGGLVKAFACVNVRVCGVVSDETAPLERLLNSCICCACTIWQERDSRKEPSRQIGVIAWQFSVTCCYSINLKKMSRGALFWPSFSMKLSPQNRMFFFTGLSSKWKNKMLIFWLKSELFSCWVEKK